MDQLALKAQPRVGGHPNRDRREGFVPAVVYGRDRASRPVRVDQHQLQLLLGHGGRHHVIHLEIEGESAARTTLVSAVQVDPVSGRPLHVDFHAVSLQERVNAEVPVRVRGEEQVQKLGGIVQHLTSQLRVSCLPGDLPEWIDVDISGISIGEVLTVGRIPAPSGVVFQHEPDEAVVGVMAPKLAAAEGQEAGAEAPAAAATSQPELVGRKPHEEAQGGEG